MKRKVYRVSTSADLTSKQEFAVLLASEKRRLPYYLFCIRWTIHNRGWGNTRQKMKRMEEDYVRKLKGQPCRYL